MSEQISTDDVHASKVSPDDARLKLNKPKGRSLKKGPIIALLAGTGAIIFIAFMLAMEDNSLVKNEEGEKDVVISGTAIPEVIRNASDVPGTTITAPRPEEVPALGKPLPGDLGAAMVEPGQAKMVKTGDSQPLYTSPRETQQQKTPEEQAYEKALTSGVSFDKGFSGAQLAASVADPSSSAMAEYAKQLAEASNQAANPFGGTDPNKQESKTAFVNDQSGQKERVSSMMTPPISPYEVKAGTIIPASLITGINSDLPGNVIAQVRENVFDTVSGNHLLIPQGSRLIGKYDSKVSYGQSRALVVWTRLIRPDGGSIRLENMPGTDLAGYAGYKDKVDNHFDRLIGGVVLSSVLSVGATMSGGDYDGTNDMSMDEVFAANAGDEINRAGNKITQKNLDIQPTIKIRPGFSVNVLVNKDMVIPPFSS